ncbi:acyl-CoA oxidase [Massarina eburnea CBS 473.64]|uniref:Acyl-coenzyme A oxidase n=1 Tax=Massarina eburnea CBS 473.64 TaxID=1395130 RepID=A0A6A6S250_9PLEO|nr:acyl-CoA oxidase [Massarina eburnea CBS 473.64]
MRKARQAASFDSFELTCLIYGGNDKVRQRRAAFERVERLSGTHDTIVLPKCYANTNREEAYDQGLKVGKIAFEDGLKYGHSFFHKMTPRYTLSNASPFGLVTLLFEPAIELNGTEEQKAKWLPLSKAGEILGSYCQTELGHGTFVRGLQTTATLDRETDEFVIHSPTISSTKFWPGGIGFSATHAIVMAMLHIDSKEHGPHLFIVQLRAVEDGKPMPGIRLGDIGLKMAYNETDNGFASFNHVRVPRTNMLMAHASLSRNGLLSTIPGHQVLTYSTMLMGRFAIARTTAFQLAQATTIATRYSVVREQGVGHSPVGFEGKEMQIIHYKSQHFRLLTLMAKSYAILFASKHCDVEYEKFRLLQQKDSQSRLSYMHSLSAGVKAWSTEQAADGAEDARKCCGGHGFLMMSGLPEIVASVTAAATFEGENYVLWQQVGRHLLKCVDVAQGGGKLGPEVTYLFDLHGSSTQPCGATGAEFLSGEVQLNIYRHRARRLVETAHKALRSSKKPRSEAWNEHMMAIISAARAHMEYTILQSFVSHLRSLPATTTPSLRSALDRLRSLFALGNMVSPRTIDVISFVEDDHLSLAQLSAIRTLVNDVAERLVPDAIGLTDGWDFSDPSLCSALGMRDGNVYENMMGWVEQLPINRRAWDHNSGVYQPGWNSFVDPVLKGKL